jgi:hypothetical protein
MPSRVPRAFSSPQGYSRPLRDLAALFLGERSPQVELEMIDLHPELADDEGHLVGHEAGNEVNITAQPVKLRHDYESALLRRSLEGCC